MEIPQLSALRARVLIVELNLPLVLHLVNSLPRVNGGEADVGLLVAEQEGGHRPFFPSFVVSRSRLDLEHV